MTKTLFVLLVITTPRLSLVHPVTVQLQLSDTLNELRGFLFPRPNTVNVSGNAEPTAYKNIAQVCLSVTMEAYSLSAAMADSQNLCNDLRSL